MEALPNDQYCPHQDLTFKLFGNPGEDYFKGNPKSLNFYFLVIWWGKNIFLKLEKYDGGKRFTLSCRHSFSETRNVDEDILPVPSLLSNKNHGIVL